MGWNVVVSYIHIPVELAAASNVPSGEYLISLISPLPNRAIAPSGREKDELGLSCAMQMDVWQVNIHIRVSRCNILSICCSFSVGWIYRIIPYTVLGWQGVFYVV